MLIVGKTDAFEQEYMAKFGALAANHGIVVKYERDRAARDIGLHLTKDLKSGKRQVTDALVWFQMKGVMATTLTKTDFETAKAVSLSMDVEHLRHWFLEKEPTHLVVYVEAADLFLVLNLQKYVAEKWGRDILTLDKKTQTVTVPASSLLDEQAFALLVYHADIAQWSKALGADPADMELVHSGADAIYAVGTADERKVECGVLYRDWISKTRDELCIVERPAGFEGDVFEGWATRHEHWQFMGLDPEESYPYLEMFALEQYEPETFVNRWGEEELVEEGQTIQLKNGDSVFSPDCSGEYYQYVFGARLNESGHRLFGYVEALLKMGLLELRADEEEGHSFVSVAPWHSRLV